MILKNILTKVDIQQCISELTVLHRQHYYEPGYIMSSKIISEKYNNVFSKLLDYKHTTQKHTINFQLSNETYQLYIQDKLLRDWFVEKSQPYSIMYYMDINYPKNLTLLAVLLEVIFELTYYSFPETVENPV